MKNVIKKSWKVLGLLMVFVFLFIAGCGNKEEEYRQIQVYKLEGKVTIHRQGSSMDAYDNMQLQSGDEIETEVNSSVQLKLDEDKYILVEPESKISLQATGNDADSKTSIYLEKGAIVNQLDKPLNDKSSYQVTTPNSTMAVRGTSFRVEIACNEKGEVYAKIAVFDGKVECNLVFADGTIAEPMMIEAGTEVQVFADETKTEYIGSGAISYEEMKLITLNFLEEIIERGEELSISKEELEELKEVAIALEEENLTEEEEAEEIAEEELESDEEDALDEEGEDESLPKKTGEVDLSDENQTEKDKTQEDMKEKTEQVESSTSTIVPDNSSGNTDSGSSSTENGSNGNSSGNTDSGSSSTGNGSNENSSSNTGQSKSITVNFVVEQMGESGSTAVFATKVMSVDSECTEIAVSDISIPLLQPAADGFWDFVEGDSIEIVNNTVTIVWKNVD